MKDRAGTVGSNGTARVVREVAAANPGARIHLVGHSLGGRLVAACAKALPPQSVASLTLLQAAFSHYGLSTNKQNQPGFFREILKNQVVRGPIIATHSDRDSTVGLAYAFASRLAGDNVKAVGDENDDFGGIGRNGTQRLESAVKQKLRKAGSPYDFKAGVVTNLNGSGDLIKDHSDIRNEAVTYAFASALART